MLYGTTIGSSAWSFLRGQLAFMRQQGAEVHVVSAPDRLLEKTRRREQVQTYGIPMEREISPLADLRSLYSWFRVIRRIRPDVVNVGTPKAALLGLIAGKACRVPVRVYTVRGLRYETTSGLKRLFLKSAEQLCCALSTHVIAVGHGVAKEMRSAKLSNKAIIVIGDGSSNGVPGAQIAEGVSRLSRTECRARLGIERDAFVIGFIGRVTSDKGSQCLSEALNLLRGKQDQFRFALLVVGDAEDVESASALKDISIPAVSTGWIDDTLPAFTAMDILCHPTRREGFPNVILEAAAARVPAITTRATGANESVVDRVTGLLIDVDDPLALCGAILELASDAEGRLTMGRHAQDRALKDYDPARIWEALVDIYRGLEPVDVSMY
ncbi:glycosyltransferase family 4 protein [Dietzia cercidiphylli]